MPSKVTQIGKYSSVKCDTSGLDNIIAGVKEQYVVRVGILGGKATQEHQRKQTGAVSPSSITNAEVGLIHEKGVKSKNIPRRSWLRTPLEDKLPDYFKKLGPELINSFIVNKSLQAYIELGLVAEQIILKGFETGGYGKWKGLKAATIAAKGSAQILVDTAQLKKSVTSQVVVA